MSLHTFANKAAKIAAQTHHVEKPLVIHQEELRHPHSGKKAYCYRVVSAKHGNGPSVTVFLDEQGGSGASADNSPNSASEALRVTPVSDEKGLEIRHS
jgi:hypothetical protein